MSDLCASPRPAPSTTARARSSAACSTTPSPSSRTSWRPWSAPEAPRRRSTPNLALLTDGLRAEREQGITIDVAYRYFATPKRKFIIADTPGHIQYTRNMVTGASTADLAIVLVDARKGVVEQSRRHAFIASLLRIPHLVLCGQQDGPRRLVPGPSSRRSRTSSAQFATKLDIADLTFIPISALHGDNVVTRSPNMPWYEGASLLHHLEEVHIASDRNLIDVRFPGPVRDPAPVRGLARLPRDAGTVAGGVLKPATRSWCCPRASPPPIAAVETADGPVDEAFPPRWRSPSGSPTRST
jgi:bifunctional enzyme CysN/CysC